MLVFKLQCMWWTDDCPEWCGGPGHCTCTDRRGIHIRLKRSNAGRWFSAVMGDKVRRPTCYSLTYQLHCWRAVSWLQLVPLQHGILCCCCLVFAANKMDSSPSDLNCLWIGSDVRSCCFDRGKCSVWHSEHTLSLCLLSLVLFLTWPVTSANHGWHNAVYFCLKTFFCCYLIVISCCRTHFGWIVSDVFCFCLNILCKSLQVPHISKSCSRGLAHYLANVCTWNSSFV